MNDGLVYFLENDRPSPFFSGSTDAQVARLTVLPRDSTLWDRQWRAMALGELARRERVRTAERKKSPASPEGPAGLGCRVGEGGAG